MALILMMKAIFYQDISSPLVLFLKGKLIKAKQLFYEITTLCKCEY